MPNILIVCTANICRSPVVEALLRERLSRMESGDWTVHSAGTWAINGNRASRYSEELVAEAGLDISGHRSRPVDEMLLAEADLVLCMETGHAEALRAEFPLHASRVHLLSGMSGKPYSVADPYGGPRAGYEMMVREVGKLIDEGLPEIVNLARKYASEKDQPRLSW